MSAVDDGAAVTGASLAEARQESYAPPYVPAPAPSAPPAPGSALPIYVSGG